jgi:RNA polymerase sigma factor (sigma-70 family)
MYNEQEIIIGLRGRDRGVMKYLYHQYYPMILDLIQKNGGTSEDASDIFQEGIIVIYEKIFDNDFEWRSSIKTYLYAVCRNKWLMQLRSKRKKGTTTLQDKPDVADETSIQRDIIASERNELMREHFKNLGKDCRQVLELFFQSKSLREIGQIMNYSEAYAKKKKFSCQQKLIKTISLDPKFKELSKL